MELSATEDGYVSLAISILEECFDLLAPRGRELVDRTQDRTFLPVTEGEGMIATIPTWIDRAHAARAASAFGQLVDRFAEEVPADLLTAYQESLDASPDDARGEFLFVVAEQLSLRIAEDRPEAITHAAALLATWFMRPR